VARSAPPAEPARPAPPPTATFLAYRTPNGHRPVEAWLARLPERRLAALAAVMRVFAANGRATHHASGRVRELRAGPDRLLFAPVGGAWLLLDAFSLEGRGKGAAFQHHLGLATGRLREFEARQRSRGAER